MGPGNGAASVAGRDLYRKLGSRGKGLICMVKLLGGWRFFVYDMSRPERARHEP